MDGDETAAVLSLADGSYVKEMVVGTSRGSWSRW